MFYKNLFYVAATVVTTKTSRGTQDPLQGTNLMRLKILTLLGGFCLLSASGAMAQSDVPKIGDIYLISRDGHQTFRGSHKIYKRKSEGLVEVSYCNRTYWVRYATVAWTELEVEQNYEVRVEHNWGKGWRPICEHPEEQVTLKGLGIEDDPRLVMHELYDNGASKKREDRFASIREAFNPQNLDEAAQSLRGE